jgi:hypothetical protein
MRRKGKAWKNHYLFDVGRLQMRRNDEKEKLGKILICSM